MNQMVEQVLAREPEREADRTEGELTETLERLRSYRGDLSTLARQFAGADVSELDPLRSEPLSDAPADEASDPLGALAGFDRAA